MKKYLLLIISIVLFLACEDKQEKDCAGVEGGVAVADNCGVCTGGTTGVTACVQDCNDDWGGTATEDNCNQCVAGNTGAVACTEDCNDDWGGTATMDNCDQCTGGNTGEIACVQDCSGIWGGESGEEFNDTNGNGVYDEGEEFNDTNGNGVYDGESEADMCGVCDSNSSNDCTQDCNGDWGGTAIVDECGFCTVDPCIQDCNGDWGGESVVDCAGVCGGTTQSEDCTVNDIDGNIYQNVQIGNQLWMAENLKVTHYRNGDEIPTGYSNSEWDNLTMGAYAVYDDIESNSDTYGYLYNWYTVDDDRGVCPESWHVPTDDEIKELEIYLGMSQEEADDTDYRGTNEGSKLAGRADLWNTGELVNNPEFGTSGFNYLPSGYRWNIAGGYTDLGDDGNFWSSTESGSNDAWYRTLFKLTSQIYRSDGGKQVGSSVHCIKD